MNKIIFSDRKELNWNNHPGLMMSNIAEMFDRRHLTDVTLVGNDTSRRIYAHQIILSSSSEYFQSLFDSNYNDSVGNALIILPDVNFSHLESLIRLMYHGNVILNCDEVEEFLDVSYALKMKFTDSLPSDLQRSKMSTNVALVKNNDLNKNYDCDDNITCDLDKQTLVREAAENRNRSMKRKANTPVISDPQKRISTLKKRQNISDDLIDSSIFEGIQNVSELYVSTPCRSRSNNEQSIEENKTIKTTSKQTSYDCSKCRKSYRWNYNLTRHMRFECGMKNRFECVYCSRRFPHKQNAIKHMVRMHQISNIDLPGSGMEDYVNWEHIRLIPPDS